MYAYFGSVLDGSPPQHEYVLTVYIFGFVLTLFNELILCALRKRVLPLPIHIHILIQFVNLSLIVPILCFAISGYNSYNNFAQDKALYEFAFIDTIIVLVNFFFIMFGSLPEAERIVLWPNNLAWPILFLKTPFPDALHTPAIVIGIVFGIISALSFSITLFYYCGWDLQPRKTMVTHWIASMIILVVLEVLTIVVLLTQAKGVDYQLIYGRAIFVIFASANLYDFNSGFSGFIKIPR
jgi:hypothetical protein